MTRLPGLDEPSGRWQLALVREIPSAANDPGSPPRLYNPRTLARFPDGTLVVLDGGDFRLVVIDSRSDAVVRRFARSGAGPGEVRSARGPIWPTPDHSLALVDERNDRLSRFALNGRLLSETPLRPARGISRSFQVRRAMGELFAHLAYANPSGGRRISTDSVARVNTETGEFDPILPLPPRVPFPEGVVPGTVLFHPRPLWAVLPSGGIVTMRTDRAEFRLFSDDGRLVREIRLPLTRRPVRDSERAEILESLGLDLGSAMPAAPTLGTHFPLGYALILVDDSIFALAHAGPQSAAEDPGFPDGTNVWRLVSTTGRPAGAVHFPRGFIPWLVTDGRVFGVALDSLGLATIQEHRLEPPGGD